MKFTPRQIGFIAGGAIIGALVLAWLTSGWLWVVIGAAAGGYGGFELEHRILL